MHDHSKDSRIPSGHPVVNRNNFAKICSLVSLLNYLSTVLLKKIFKNKK